MVLPGPAKGAFTHQQKALVFFCATWAGSGAYAVSIGGAEKAACMAIFCYMAKIIGGGVGRSAVGAAAYRTGENLHHERDGIGLDYTNRRGANLRSAVGAAAYRAGEALNEHDFTHKSEIIHNEIMLPSHAPETYKDRATLWNAAEKAEKQHNARTGREIVVALPNELTYEQHIEMMRDYVQRNFVNKGMCADFSIHAGHIHDRPDEVYPFEDLAVRKENPHAHIQLTVRPINADGTWGAKSKKEYILDRNGERIRLASGRWKSRKIDSTDWDKVETLIKWRENWAATVNGVFERLGIDERISHLSLKQQGIEREPTAHMGYTAWALEKKGIRTAVGDENRAIMARNRGLERERNPEIIAERLHDLKERYVGVEGQISAITAEISGIERKKIVAIAKAEEVGERAEYIQSLQEKMAKMRGKKQDVSMLLRSHEQAVSYFKREFGIGLEGAETVIKQLELQAEGLGRTAKSLQDKLPPLLADREAFKQEYHKRRLLADIRRDRARILERLERLERLEKETRGKLTPKEVMVRMGIVDGLDGVERENVRDYGRNRGR